MKIGHGATKSKYDLPSQHQLRRQDIGDGGRPQSHSNTASRQRTKYSDMMTTFDSMTAEDFCKAWMI